MKAIKEWSPIVLQLVTVVLIGILAFGVVGYEPVVVESPQVVLPEPGGEVGIEAATNLDSLELSGDLTVAGATSSTGAASLNAVSIDDLLNLDPIEYTSVGAQTLDPAGSYYELAPVSVLTLTITTTNATAGDILILASTVATTTTVVDTGATVGGGAITLAANDMAWFIYLDDIWAEIASPDNS